MTGIRIGVCSFKPLADVWRNITPYRRERPASLELDMPGELLRKAELSDQRQRCQKRLLHCYGGPELCQGRQKQIHSNEEHFRCSRSFSLLYISSTSERDAESHFACSLQATAVSQA